MRGGERSKGKERKNRGKRKGKEKRKEGTEKGREGTYFSLLLILSFFKIL